MTKTTRGKIRVAIVEDQGLVREGLARILAGESDIEVAARCAGLEEAYRAVEEAAPDVVLLDYALGPGERGSDFVAWLRRQRLEGKVLVVTAAISDAEALEMLRLGIAGIFLKQGSPELLAKAIRKVVEGECWLDQHYLKLLLHAQAGSEPRPRPLSPRERAVLRGVFEGLGNKEISSRLGVSESTVKSVLQQLFDKTGVRTRGQLVRVAIERYRDEL